MLNVCKHRVPRYAVKVSKRFAVLHENIYGCAHRSTTATSVRYKNMISQSFGSYKV